MSKQLRQAKKGFTCCWICSALQERGVRDKSEETKLGAEEELEAAEAKGKEKDKITCTCCKCSSRAPSSVGTESRISRQRRPPDD